MTNECTLKLAHAHVWSTHIELDSSFAIEVRSRSHLTQYHFFFIKSYNLFLLEYFKFDKNSNNYPNHQCILYDINIEQLYEASKFHSITRNNQQEPNELLSR